MFTNVLGAQSYLVNYQGQLTDAQGQPLATKGYKLDLRIWDAPNGGAQLWHKTFVNTQVVNGQFNVVLGADDSGVSIADVLYGGDRYLELVTAILSSSFNMCSEWKVEVFSSPREFCRSCRRRRGMRFFAVGVEPADDVDSGRPKPFAVARLDVFRVDEQGRASTSIAPGRFEVLAHLLSQSLS